MDNSKELDRFYRELEKLNQGLNESARRIVSRQANTGLRAAKENTPKKTGFLRKNWFRLKVKKAPGGYTAGYFNNVAYGSCVNDGHRLVNKQKETIGWVDGKHMLETSVDEADKHLPTLFEQEIQRLKEKAGF